MEDVFAKLDPAHAERIKAEMEAGAKQLAENVAKMAGEPMVEKEPEPKVDEPKVDEPKVDEPKGMEEVARDDTFVEKFSQTKNVKSSGKFSLRGK